MFALLLVGVLAAAIYGDRFQGKAVGAALGLGAVVLAVRAAQSFAIVSEIWWSVAPLTPIAALLGGIGGVGQEETGRADESRTAASGALRAKTVENHLYYICVAFSAVAPPSTSRNKRTPISPCVQIFRQTVARCSRLFL